MDLTTNTRTAAPIQGEPRTPEKDTCCPPQEQSRCCAPAEKTECCGPSNAQAPCGCR